MRTAAKFSLILAFVVLLLPGALSAESNHKINFEAGSHAFLLHGDSFQVTTSDSIKLILRYENGVYGGYVVPGENANSVPVAEVILLGSPNQILFSGKVGKATPLDKVFPQETGHSEL